jgi:hypothetical protein
MEGWIKLHRRIIEKGYYKSSKHFHLWVHLLLKANHKRNEFMWNNNLIVVKEGQFITGRKRLSEETGIDESSVERILKMLENEQQIEQQKTTKYRLITIVNWSDYQQNEQQIEQQTNNKRTTSEQQVNTNKNDKNDKNDKKETLPPDFQETLDVWNNFASKYNLNKIIKLSSKRLSSIKNRMNEKEFDLVKILGLISSSPFLKGENQQGWKVDFDFVFCSKNNYLKILEGKYNGRPKATGVYAKHITEDKLRGIAEDIANEFANK